MSSFTVAKPTVERDVRIESDPHQDPEFTEKSNGVSRIRVVNPKVNRTARVNNDIDEGYISSDQVPDSKQNGTARKGWERSPQIVASVKNIHAASSSRIDQFRRAGGESSQKFRNSGHKSTERQPRHSETIGQSTRSQSQSQSSNYSSRSVDSGSQHSRRSHSRKRHKRVTSQASDTRENPRQSKRSQSQISRSSNDFNNTSDSGLESSDNSDEHALADRSHEHARTRTHQRTDKMWNRKRTPVSQAGQDNFGSLSSSSVRSDQSSDGGTNTPYRSSNVATNNLNKTLTGKTIKIANSDVAHPIVASQRSRTPQIVQSHFSDGRNASNVDAISSIDDSDSRPYETRSSAKNLPGVNTYSNSGSVDAAKAGMIVGGLGGAAAAAANPSNGADITGKDTSGNLSDDEIGATGASPQTELTTTTYANENARHGRNSRIANAPLEHNAYVNTSTLPNQGQTSQDPGQVSSSYAGASTISNASLLGDPQTSGQNIIPYSSPQETVNSQNNVSYAPNMNQPDAFTPGYGTNHGDTQFTNRAGNFFAQSQSYGLSGAGPTATQQSDVHTASESGSNPRQQDNQRSGTSLSGRQGMVAREAAAGAGAGALAGGAILSSDSDQSFSSSDSGSDASYQQEQRQQQQLNTSGSALTGGQPYASSDSDAESQSSQEGTQTTLTAQPVYNDPSGQAVQGEPLTYNPYDPSSNSAPATGGSSAVVQTYDPSSQQSYNPPSQQSYDSSVQPSYNPSGQESYDPSGQQSYDSFSQQAEPFSSSYNRPSYDPSGSAVTDTNDSYTSAGPTNSTVAVGPSANYPPQSDNFSYGNNSQTSEDAYNPAPGQNLDNNSYNQGVPFSDRDDTYNSSSATGQPLNNDSYSQTAVGPNNVYDPSGNLYNSTSGQPSDSNSYSQKNFTPNNAYDSSGQQSSGNRSQFGTSESFASQSTAQPAYDRNNSGIDYNSLSAVGVTSAQGSQGNLSDDELDNNQPNPRISNSTSNAVSGSSGVNDITSDTVPQSGYQNAANGQGDLNSKESYSDDEVDGKNGSDTSKLAAKYGAAGAVGAAAIAGGALAASSMSGDPNNGDFDSNQYDAHNQQLQNGDSSTKSVSQQIDAPGSLSDEEMDQDPQAVMNNAGFSTSASYPSDQPLGQERIASQPGSMDGFPNSNVINPQAVGGGDNQSNPDFQEGKQSSMNYNGPNDTFNDPSANQQQGANDSQIIPGDDESYSAGGNSSFDPQARGSTSQMNDQNSEGQSNANYDPENSSYNPASTSNNDPNLYQGGISRANYGENANGDYGNQTTDSQGDFGNEQNVSQSQSLGNEPNSVQDNGSDVQNPPSSFDPQARGEPNSQGNFSIDPNAAQNSGSDQNPSGSDSSFDSSFDTQGGQNGQANYGNDQNLSGPNSSFDPQARGGGPDSQGNFGNDPNDAQYLGNGQNPSGPSPESQSQGNDPNGPNSAQDLGYDQNQNLSGANSSFDPQTRGGPDSQGNFGDNSNDPQDMADGQNPTGPSSSLDGQDPGLDNVDPNNPQGQAGGVGSQSGFGNDNFNDPSSQGNAFGDGNGNNFDNQGNASQIENQNGGNFDNDQMNGNNSNMSNFNDPNGVGDRGMNDDGYGNQQNDGFGNQNDGYGNQNDGFGNQNDGYGNQNDGFGNQNDGYGNQNDEYGNQNGFNDGFGSQNDGYGQNGFNDGYGQNGFNDGYGQNGFNDGYGQNGFNDGYGQNGFNDRYGQNGFNDGYDQNGFNDGYGQYGNGNDPNYNDQWDQQNGYDPNYDDQWANNGQDNDRGWDDRNGPDTGYQPGLDEGYISGDSRSASPDQDQRSDWNNSPDDFTRGFEDDDDAHGSSDDSGYGGPVPVPVPIPRGDVFGGPVDDQVAKGFQPDGQGLSIEEASNQYNNSVQNYLSAKNSGNPDAANQALAHLQTTLFTLNKAQSQQSVVPHQPSPSEWGMTNEEFVEDHLKTYPSGTGIIPNLKNYQDSLDRQPDGYLQAVNDAALVYAQVYSSAKSLANPRNHPAPQVFHSIAHRPLRRRRSSISMLAPGHHHPPHRRTSEHRANHLNNPVHYNDPDQHENENPAYQNYLETPGQYQEHPQVHTRGRHLSHMDLHHHGFTDNHKSKPSSHHQATVNDMHSSLQTQLKRLIDAANTDRIHYDLLVVWATKRMLDRGQTPTHHFGLSPQQLKDLGVDSSTEFKRKARALHELSSDQLDTLEKGLNSEENIHDQTLGELAKSKEASLTRDLKELIHKLPSQLSSLSHWKELVTPIFNLQSERLSGRQALILIVHRRLQRCQLLTRSQDNPSSQCMARLHEAQRAKSKQDIKYAACYYDDFKTLQMIFKTLISLANNPHKYLHENKNQYLREWTKQVEEAEKHAHSYKIRLRVLEARDAYDTLKDAPHTTTPIELHYAKLALRLALVDDIDHLLKNNNESQNELHSVRHYLSSLDHNNEQDTNIAVRTQVLSHAPNSKTVQQAVETHLEDTETSFQVVLSTLKAFVEKFRQEGSKHDASEVEMLNGFRNSFKSTKNQLDHLCAESSNHDVGEHVIAQASLWEAERALNGSIKDGDPEIIVERREKDVLKKVMHAETAKNKRLQNYLFKLLGEKKLLEHQSFEFPERGYSEEGVDHEIKQIKKALYESEILGQQARDLHLQVKQQQAVKKMAFESLKIIPFPPPTFWKGEMNFQQFSSSDQSSLKREPEMERHQGRERYLDTDQSDSYDFFHSIQRVLRDPQDKMAVDTIAENMKRIRASRYDEFDNYERLSREFPSDEHLQRSMSEGSYSDADNLHNLQSHHPVKNSDPFHVLNNPKDHGAADALYNLVQEHRPLRPASASRSLELDPAHPLFKHENPHSNDPISNAIRNPDSQTGDALHELLNSHKPENTHHDHVPRIKPIRFTQADISSSEHITNVLNDPSDPQRSRDLANMVNHYKTKYGKQATRLAQEDKRQTFPKRVDLLSNKHGFQENFKSHSKREGAIKRSGNETRPMPQHSPSRNPAFDSNAPGHQVHRALLNPSDPESSRALEAMISQHRTYANDFSKPVDFFAPIADQHGMDIDINQRWHQGNEELNRRKPYWAGPEHRTSEKNRNSSSPRPIFVHHKNAQPNHQHSASKPLSYSIPNSHTVYRRTSNVIKMMKNTRSSPWLQTSFEANQNASDIDNLLKYGRSYQSIGKETLTRHDDLERQLPFSANSSCIVS